MCFQDVAFLNSRASFSTTFPRNCGRGESPRTAKLPKTVIGDNQGHAPCQLLQLQHSLFLYQLNSMENIRRS